MPIRLMLDFDTMGVGSGLGLSKDLEIGKKIGSCIDILKNWVYHRWEGHTGVIMIKVHSSLIALANTLPIRTKGGKAYPFRCV